MTAEQALDRLIEKLEERAVRYPTGNTPDDELAVEWSRGVAAATKWALEDATMLRELITRTIEQAIADERGTTFPA